MSVKEIFVICVLVVFIDNGNQAAVSRQKRCIVIQKQSGGGGESEADYDDDYRKPQPKKPANDRLRKPEYSDTENVPPELLKYRLSPMAANNEYKLRKRLFRKYL